MAMMVLSVSTTELSVVVTMRHGSSRI